MADEIVGDVRVDVHGNTDPLKDDVRRAAKDIGKTLDTEISSGNNDAVTKNIVRQVADAEEPSGKEAQKVGRAIAKGVDVGSQDVDVTARLNENLRRAEAPLREKAARLGRGLRDALGTSLTEATQEIRSDVKVDIDVNRDQFRADLAATEQEWDDFGKSMTQSLEQAFTPWWKMRAALRDDAKVKIEVEREKFRADLAGTQRDWFDFGQTMGATIDRALAPWWKRLPQRLHAAFDDDRGSLQIGPRRIGHNMGTNLLAGIRLGISGADKAGGFLLGGLVKGAMAVGPQALLYGVGARLAAVLGGGLLSGLATVSTAVGGWAAGIVGQVGTAIAGAGAVVAGTLATAFAGLGATAYSSIAAVAPALIGLKLAFAGLDKEEKKALEDRFKNATSAFKGFGQAVRDELLDPLFGALKTLEAFVPTLKSFGTALGATAGGLATNFAETFTRGPMIKEVNTFLQASVGYFGQLGDAGINMAAAILPAFNAIAPVTEKFFDNITKGMKGIADWIEKISEGGRNSTLTKTLDEWYERGRALFNVFKTVAGSVIKIFDAAVKARGDQFLDSLQNVADKFSHFIDVTSADGRLSAKLGEWYDRGADLMRAFGNLSKIVVLFFDSAASASGDALGGFAEATDRWLAKFEFFRSSGQLGGVLEQWYDQGKKLMDILGNVARTVGNIFGAATGGSDDFLTSFEKVTSAWEKWTTSFTGSQTLKDYFSGSESVLGEVVGLLGDVAGMFGSTFTTPADNLKNLFQDMREVWVPALEGLVRSFRNSGIQDAIFNLVEALGGLDDGGVIGKTFEMLAVAIDIIAGALRVMGPFVPAFVTFVAAVRTLALLKMGAKGLGLFALADGIKAVANARIAAATGVAVAGQAVAGAAGTVAAKGAGVAGTAAAGAAGETGAEAAKRLAAQKAAKRAAARAATLGVATAAEAGATAAIGGAGLAAAATALAPLVAIAAVAAGGFLLVNKAVSGAKENIDQFSKASNLTVDAQAKGYGESLSTFEKWGTSVKDFATNWHNLIPGVAIVNGFKAINNVFGNGGESARNLEFLRGGMENFRVEAEKLATSGNFDAAYDKIDDLKKLLAESGGDPKILADIDAINEAVKNSQIENLTGQISDLAASGDWKVATDKAGQFLQTLSAAGVDTSKLAEIRQWTIDLLTATASGDAVATTGTLDPKVIAQAEEDLKTVEGMWKNGKWTEAGKEAKAKLIAGFHQMTFGPTLQQNLDEITRTLATFDPTKGLSGEWTKEGLTLRAKVFAEADWTSINGVKNALPKDGEEYKIIMDLVKDPKNWDPATGELKLPIQEQIVNLQLEGVEKAKEKLNSLWGFFKDNSKKPGFVPGFNKVENLVTDGKGKGVPKTKQELADQLAGSVEFEVKAAVEKSEYDAFLKGVETGPATKIPMKPDTSKLGPATVQPIVSGYYNKNPIVIPVKFSLPPMPTAPKPSGGIGPSGYPTPGNPNLRMITPSMISPGGPTTMGYGESTPLAAGRASLVSGGPGVVGSPNRWNGDDDPKAKNVTINNYYPEPERASDTVAMSLRLARYGG